MLRDLIDLGWRPLEWYRYLAWGAYSWLVWRFDVPAWLECVAMAHWPCSADDESEAA